MLGELKSTLLTSLEKEFAKVANIKPTPRRQIGSSARQQRGGSGVNAQADEALKKVNEQLLSQLENSDWSNRKVAIEKVLIEFHT